MIKKMYERWQKHLIKQAMKTRRVLILSGARQCGKTTLCKEISSEDTIYRTLDNKVLLDAAKNDPRGFVKHEGSMLIIDEVQHVPELLPAIKEIVDEDTRAGQYLLTGSSNIQSLPSVRESLAGRARKIRLRNLTQGEILGIQPSFIEKAFLQSFKSRRIECSQDDVIQKAFKGGFPEALMLEDRERKQWHKDYISSLLERDLKDIVNIRRQDSMRSLVSILAAWSGKLMDISAIGSGLAIRRLTIESYINALESLYLIESVNPWIKTDYDRVGKKSKLFMTDCGLMASILGWKTDEIKFDGDRLGKIVETFIFNEISAQIDVNPGEYELFHYRDKEKREIDFLVEKEDGSLLAIEVKSGSAVNKNSFKHLKWFAHNLAKNKSFVGIVFYTGEYAVSFGENMWAIPISTLWD